MLERRKEQRWPAYLGGRIVSERRESTADCLIRNTSASGARLVLHQAALLPAQFSLQIPTRQAELRVRICWRRFDQIGVEATFEQKSDQLDLAVTREMRRLDEQTAQLKRRLAELSKPPV
jgi:hypothetical protein